MIGWGEILYGAALSTALGAVLLVVVLREQSARVLAPALAATLLGPLAWNAILRETRSPDFFVDLPFKPFPVSWQDTGSGVFTLALAAVFLGVVLRHDPAGRVVRLAAVVALVAFVVDIYLY